MNPKTEITDLTICRAIFAGWVFIYHVDLYLNFSAWLGPFAGLIRHGYLGVDGFFILSGLILARVHPELAESRSNILRFYGKRLARIYPVHLATLLILALIFMAGVSAGLTPRDPGRFGTAPLVQNILLVHAWGFPNESTWNYPSWSISTEWAGYLLFPFIWMILSYLEPIVAIQIIVIGFTCLGLIMARNHASLNVPFIFSLLRFFPEFIIGMATARIVPEHADHTPQQVFIGAGLIFVLIFALAGYDALVVVGIWAILFAFTTQADAERPALLGQRPVLHRLGLLSYAFYMSFATAELLVIQWFRHESWSPASHPWLFTAAMTAITFLFATTLHVTLEVPVRQAADGWLGPVKLPPKPVGKKGAKPGQKPVKKTVKKPATK